MGSEHEFHMEKPLAEMVGTFAMVFIGCGAIMVHETQAIPNAHLNVCLCFGLVIMVMIYACGHISGAHFNPAVTLAFAATKKFPWREVPYYILGQLVGAILASVFLFQLLGPVSHLGSTIPQVVPFKAFIMEIVLAFFLMWVITAVATDHRAEGQMAGLAIGGTVALAALMGGPISGASMNPARSFAPALVDGDLQYLWIYIAGPIIGAYLGALCYHKVSRARPHEELEIEESLDIENIKTKAAANT
jgi:aquaporin NIP